MAFQPERKSAKKQRSMNKSRESGALTSLVWLEGSGVCMVCVCVCVYVCVGESGWQVWHMRLEEAGETVLPALKMN